MRLIDADESVQHLKEDAELALEIKESGIYAGLYNAMEDINKQQTAYFRQQIWKEKIIDDR